MHFIAFRVYVEDKIRNNLVRNGYESDGDLAIANASFHELHLSRTVMVEIP